MESCRKCVSSSKACAAAYKVEGGMENCVKACYDCASICELCVTLGENGSPLFLKSIELCLVACTNSLTVCETGKNEICTQFTQQCLDCIVEFNNLIENQ